MSFFSRLKAAWNVLVGTLPAPVEAPPTPALPPPPASHDAALFLLAILQREGRLVDFLNEDLTGAADADVGQAVRVVHAGCRQALVKYLPTAPVVSTPEGERMTVPAGYDASAYKLVGAVSGPGPWTGAVRHPGWKVVEVKLPPVPASVDLKVICPAEVEL